VVCCEEGWLAQAAREASEVFTPVSEEGILPCFPSRRYPRHGTQDATHPVSHARKLHAAVPASTLAEIPDAAHMAHFDDPRAWVAEIRGFLAPGT
jgi:pimeloyl-ACP methyl ester carboxylesterase